MPNWITREIRLLREIYPDARRRAIQRALPTHSWSAVKVRAHHMGIARCRRDHGPPVIPPIKPEHESQEPFRKMALNMLKRVVRAQLQFAELRSIR